MFVEKDEVWTMRQGETDQAERKKSFRLNPEERFADVIRSIAGLANNKGGYPHRQYGRLAGQPLLAVTKNFSPCEDLPPPESLSSAQTTRLVGLAT